MPSESRRSRIVTEDRRALAPSSVNYAMVDSRKRGTGKQADLEEEEDDDEEAEYSDKVQDAELAERAKAQGTSLPAVQICH